MKTGDLWKLLIGCGTTLCVGLSGSFFSVNRAPDDWYQTLEKPVFTPPAWIFGPAWTILYIMMGVAVFYIWRKGIDNSPVKWALAWFVLQLILNAMWSPLFFGLNWIGIAFFEIMALWVAVLVTTLSFQRVSKIAALLFYPYLVWLTFAVVLNGSIWWMNG
jgi:tryptophan-rich sensory protein